MTETTEREWVARLDTVRARLESLARVEPSTALTDPDPETGERWECGQVWAHVAEFPAYWTGQLRSALALPPGEVPPFGRVSTDPVRLAAIERGRSTPAAALWARIAPQLDDLRGLIDTMSADDWSRRVRHQTLGDLDMNRVLELFLVGHLEAHADQLDALVPR